MTLPFNPLRAADLARQARDARRCQECRGDGFKTYSDTTCGRGGAGGQMITTADCHRCKGQGWILAPDAIDVAEQLEAAVEQLQYERDHSKMLSDSNSALHVEKRAVEDYCAKVRGEYTAAVDRYVDLASNLHSLADEYAGPVAIDSTPQSDLSAIENKIAGTEDERDEMRRERDSLRASCEQLTRERDEERQRADVNWQSFLRARDEREMLRSFVQDIADDDCSYGDGCPPSARHYVCQPCKAQRAIDSALSSTHQAGTK